MSEQNIINKQTEDLLVQKSSGDPYVHYEIIGTKNYSTGIDDSDGDKLKITDGANPSSGTEILTIDPASSNAIKFNNAYEFPTTDGTANYVLATDGAGNVDWQLNSATGKLVQQVYTTTNSYLNIATTIPFDDTIPQQTEGTEILTVAITPTSTTNILIIQGLINATVDSTSTWALFQDTTANALSAGFMRSGSGRDGVSFPFSYRMTAGTTSSTTFKIRVGKEFGGGELYINGDNNSRKYGGICISSLLITEIVG